MSIVVAVEHEIRLRTQQIPGMSDQNSSSHVPVLHLHGHVHASVVDEKAREVTSRLVTQHGKIFTHLSEEIIRVSETMRLTPRSGHRILGVPPVCPVPPSGHPNFKLAPCSKFCFD